MNTRMVRFDSAVPRFRRVVRQVADELGKKVDLILRGVDADIDRSVLENIVSPLEHMLRNAIFHGIEEPEKRIAVDKAETGRISLSLQREGAELVLQLADDGAGLNFNAIRKKGEENGMLQPGQQVNEQELIQLLLQPGFSTAQEVSQTAGRGVGMDVLNEAVSSMRGALQIQSRQQSIPTSSP